MHKVIVLTAFSCLSYVYNVHAMMLVEQPHNPIVQKVLQFQYAMLKEPWQSFELIQTYVKEHIDEINSVNPSTGNTLLHEDVIEFCWGEKKGRLLRIAALLACGADRTQRNLEDLTPIECAQYAGNQVAIDLLSVKKPGKQTLISLVTKYNLEDLKPLLLEQ